MAVTLTLVGKTTGQTQFGLDTFTEHYKCDATANVVLTDGSVPQIGTAHPDYDFMFVTNRYCSETSESASALDLIYTGCLAGNGTPTLPAQQSNDSDAVMSATSSRGADGRVLISPISVQYYGPQTQLRFITYAAKGTAGTVADPTDDIRPITLTIGDTTYLPTGLLADVVANFFSVVITDTIDSDEIVATKYWLNTERKNKTLLPAIFAITAGDYILMYAPGAGYTVGNDLTMTDGMGHTAIIHVQSVGIGNSIVGFSITSNSFDYTTSSPIFTSGGSGSGAGFYNYHIT